MNLFYQHAVPLAVEVARRALAGLPYGADEIGQLVFVTSTGFIAPGVDVAIVKELGLPRVGFACCGQLHGMRGRDER